MGHVFEGSFQFVHPPCSPLHQLITSVVTWFRPHTRRTPSLEQKKCVPLCLRGHSLSYQMITKSPHYSAAPRKPPPRLAAAAALSSRLHPFRPLPPTLPPPPPPHPPSTCTLRPPSPLPPPLSHAFARTEKNYFPYFQARKRWQLPPPVARFASLRLAERATAQVVPSL